MPCKVSQRRPPLTEIRGVFLMMNYRKLYERHYGIKIPKGFHVHHIDGNRENNTIRNLILLPGKIHSELHFIKNSLLGFRDEDILKMLSSPHNLQWIKSQFVSLVDIMPDLEFWTIAKEMEDLAISQGSFNNGKYSYETFRK